MMLVVSELKKSFTSREGNIPVLDVTAFSMEIGEHLALRGESGSGKTTFLHAIAGIVAPDSGHVTIDGVEMNRLSEPARDRLRAEKLGYIFQTFNLLQGYTCLENVMLGMSFGSGRVDRRRACGLLERMGLREHQDRFPRQLSTGQQQRVAVARALANRPKLVLADEPTGNLDRKHALAAIALIREVCRENHAALLLVTHDEATLADFAHVRDLREINRVHA